jgi:GH25 family lysozyme M1 (1,4-beta-N-acetylmuramidase)
MPEEKKGHFKVTIDVEVNEELMDLMKETMSKMRWKMPEIMKRQGEEK